MKRFYISLFVLLAVILTALWIHYSIDSNTQTLISSIENLYDIARYVEEDTLIKETQHFMNQWQKSKKFLKCVTSNTHIESAQRCIDLLLTYTSDEDRSAYRQACFDAKDSIATIKNNEKIVKENILCIKCFIHK